MSRWDRYVLRSRIWMETSRSGTVPHIGPYTEAFSFSLRGRSKELLQSLPKNSINSWDKCKDAFTGKYYPPAKIIQLRSNIMNFRQLDNEHVAQAWERMKSLV